MAKTLKLSEYSALFSAIFIIGLIITAPTVCATGAKAGLRICADVLIPALFPFAVPVIFIINTNAFRRSKYKALFIFALSLLGGYPVGARLIFEVYRNGDMDKETAEKILPFCVNAGPAFTVLAVGKGLLGDIKYGYILLAAHLLTATLLALIFIRKELFVKITSNSSEDQNTLAENLVLSINRASGAVLSLCSFVIIFSVINGYILHFSKSFCGIRVLIFITEITSAVKNTGNVYIIAFLLGFAGISVWTQVFAVSGKIKPGLARFAVYRILSGAVGALFTQLLFKLFSVSAQTLSNGVFAPGQSFSSGLALSISLTLMVLLLAINLSSKKISGNIFKDML